MRLVTCNIVTLDGRIAASARPGWLDPDWQPLDEHVPFDVRALHGARVSLQGSSSFVGRDDGPADFDDHAGADVPPGDFLPASVADHPGAWMVVLDSRARVRWTVFEDGGTKVAVLLATTTPAPYRAFLRANGVPYLEIGAERVDLPLALDRLGEVFGVDVVVSDAGGVINGLLLRAGLVDEVDVQVIPAVVGRPGAPAAFEGLDPGSSGVPRRLTLLTTETTADGSVFCRYGTDRTTDRTPVR